MNYVLIDFESTRNALLPFTFTRPIAEIRVGILTIAEKWKHYLKSDISYKTESYLQQKYPFQKGDTNTFINASVLPSVSLVQEIAQLKEGQALVEGDTMLAYVAKDVTEISALQPVNVEKIGYIRIANVWDIFSKNHQAIEDDFKILTLGRKSADIPSAVFTVNAEQIFVEEGAKLYNGSLNALDGPIYIGKDAEIMENCSVRGPFSLGEHATLKMGAKIYTGTTIGPHCKVGGEVSNSVIFGYSNKGHDGFLGNSVLGEWCNLGADTNNSNLKNNYAPVRLWNYETEKFAHTGLQFCGLMMGDHSKCAINTMFNTGTVVGVSANIFGAGFPRNFIPSFTWGGSQGSMTYKTDKAFEVATVVMQRRNIPFSEVDKAILEEVFHRTAKYRK